MRKRKIFTFCLQIKFLAWKPSGKIYPLSAYRVRWALCRWFSTATSYGSYIPRRSFIPWTTFSSLFNVDSSSYFQVSSSLLLPVPNLLTKIRKSYHRKKFNKTINFIFFLQNSRPLKKTWIHASKNFLCAIALENQKYCGGLKLSIENYNWVKNFIEISS